MALGAVGLRFHAERRLSVVTAPAGEIEIGGALHLGQRLLGHDAAQEPDQHEDRCTAQPEFPGSLHQIHLLSSAGYPLPGSGLTIIPQTRIYAPIFTAAHPFRAPATASRAATRGASRSSP